jgi:tRNA U38,U39,U40 pseudouridine synthase TruA
MGLAKALSECTPELIQRQAVAGRDKGVHAVGSWEAGGNGTVHFVPS